MREYLNKITGCCDILHILCGLGHKYNPVVVSTGNISTILLKTTTYSLNDGTSGANNHVTYDLRNLNIGSENFSLRLFYNDCF